MSAPVPGIPIPSKVPRWAALFAWQGGVWVTVGERVVNLGKVFQVITEGLTAPAGSGGPTGTTTYTEPSPGGAVWEYIGVVAATWATGSVLVQGTQRVGVAVPYVYIVLGQGGGNSTVDPSSISPVPSGPFATIDGYTWQFMSQSLAVVTEPSEGQKDVGWLPGQQPPAQYLNWYMHRVYKTLLWLYSRVSTFIAFAFADGVRRIATVPDIATLQAMLPNAPLLVAGQSIALNAFRLDVYGNLWQATTVTSGPLTSGTVTWSPNVYPGATNSTDSIHTTALIWTCIALAGNTPSAPLFDPTVVYAANAVVSDPNGLFWFAESASGLIGTAPAWATSDLVVSNATQVTDGGGTVWQLAGLGQNAFVNNGDTIAVGTAYGQRFTLSTGGGYGTADGANIIQSTPTGFTSAQWANTVFASRGAGATPVQIAYGVPALDGNGFLAAQKTGVSAIAMNVPGVAGFGTAGDWSPGPSTYFGVWKDQTGKVKMRGSWGAAGGGSDQTLFTLPAGWRPKETRSFLVPDTSGTVNTYQVNISSGGVVISLGTVSGGQTLYLDSIEFLAEQ